MAFTDINNPELYMQSKLYSGTGSSQAITFDGDENMSPNLVWLKTRSHTDNHTLFNTISGATKRIFSNLNQQESTEATSLTSFDSNGFTLGSDALANASGRTFVAWGFKEASGIFDIVSFTGNDTARTISHSLSAVPNMIILKDLDAANDWFVYHSGNTSAPETDYLKLNSTAATADLNTLWNDTAPTSSVFTIGTNGNINTTGNDYIAFLFANKQGVLNCGSYTGNGSTSAAAGPFIYTGFSPAFLIIKSTDTANWEMFDNKRIVAGYPAELHPHADAPESTPPGDRRLFFTSNGFKIDTSYADPVNNNGEVYTYMAFAEAPFVNSKGVPCNAR